MAIDVGEDTVGTGDATCQVCTRNFFKEAGCEYCRATRRASAELRARQFADQPKVVGQWWCAVPNGTKAYSSPEKVSQNRPVMDLAPGVYKWILGKWTWRGFAIRIGESERFGEIWILQRDDAGVHVRKNRAEAERVMQEAVRAF